MMLPQRFVSLWDMLQLNANGFVNCLEYIVVVEGALHANATIDDPHLKQLADKAKDLSDALKDFSTPATSAALARMLHKLNSVPVDRRKVHNDLEAIKLNLEAELRNKSMWILNGEESELVRNHRSPFGNQVSLAFPQISEDLEEAALCLAAGRNVACVFHLMRAMERCVHAVTEKLCGKQITKFGVFSLQI